MSGFIVLNRCETRVASVDLVLCMSLLSPFQPPGDESAHAELRPRPAEAAFCPLCSLSVQPRCRSPGYRSKLI